MLCSIPFLLAWFVLGLARPDWFQSSRLATIVLWGLVVAVLPGGTSPSPTLRRPDLASALDSLLRRLAPKRTHGAAPRCPRWDLGTHSTSQRDDPRPYSARCHRRLRRVPQPQSARADKRGALRDHDAPGILVLLPKPVAHHPPEECLIQPTLPNDASDGENGRTGIPHDGSILEQPKDCSAGWGAVHALVRSGLGVRRWAKSWNRSSHSYCSGLP